MGLYRKKPVVVEAVCFNPHEGPAPKGVCFCGDPGAFARRRGWIEAHIHTLEGVMIVDPGDWVITGVKGEIYPCKPDIFAATYESAEVAGE